jgi:hypothetical protein
LLSRRESYRKIERVVVAVGVGQQDRMIGF